MRTSQSQQKEGKVAKPNHNWTILQGGSIKAMLEGTRSVHADGDFFLKKLKVSVGNQLHLIHHRQIVHHQYSHLSQPDLSFFYFGRLSH